MQEYTDWINSNYPTSQSAVRQCVAATLAMIAKFPELSRIRGLAAVKEPYGASPTKTNHWWCVDSNGEVFDPTGHQWPTYVVEYFPADESRTPSGKCLNCGDLCYDGYTMCTKKCNKEYVTYLKQLS